jgi:hypothetical protein
MEINQLKSVQPKMREHKLVQGVQAEGVKQTGIKQGHGV